jgi:hypothetical protein
LSLDSLAPLIEEQREDHVDEEVPALTAAEQPTILPTSYATSWDLTCRRQDGRHE